jgi:ABC-type branched-subunit amino acid transport system ATPase component
MNSVVLSCERLHGGYGETEVLHDIGLEIRAGDVYALMGKNGAGKTTLLLTLLGVIKPTSGRIQISGADVVGWPTHRIIKKGVACAPQESSFFQDLTVDENLRLGSLHLSSQAFQRGRDRVVEMFPFLGSRLQQKAGTLSGGEQAMAKVARALLPEPELILLDEVTEGLQPLTVERVRDVLVREHAERRITILVVEQNIDFVAGLANRYGLIERGAVSGEGAFSDSNALGRISQHLSI